MPINTALSDSRWPAPVYTVPREAIFCGRHCVRHDRRIANIKRGSRWVSPMPVRLTTDAVLRVSDQAGRSVRTEPLPAGTDAFSEKSRDGLFHWIAERRVSRARPTRRGLERSQRLRRFAHTHARVGVAMTHTTLPRGAPGQWGVCGRAGRTTTHDRDSRGACHHSKVRGGQPVAPVIATANVGRSTPSNSSRITLRVDGQCNQCPLIFTRRPAIRVGWRCVA
jgi:hypothetical protein